MKKILRTLLRSQAFRVCAFSILAVVLISGGYGAYSTWFSPKTPSCDWQVKLRGAENSPEAGLARCYLRYLAMRDINGLTSIAVNIPPSHLTASSLEHSSDTRSGVATVTIHLNPNDPDSAWASIIFADGKTEQVGMENMEAMGGSSYWRMAIG